MKQTGGGRKNKSCRHWTDRWFVTFCSTYSISIPSYHLPPGAGPMGKDDFGLSSNKPIRESPGVLEPGRVWGRTRGKITLNQTHQSIVDTPNLLDTKIHRRITHRHLEEPLWSLELQWAQGAWISRITPPTSLSAGQIISEPSDTYTCTFDTTQATKKSTSNMSALLLCGTILKLLDGSLVFLRIHWKHE